MRDRELRKQYTGLVPTVSELPGDLASLAGIIEREAPGQGVSITMKIATEFRGTHIYCHNLDALKRGARDRWIIEQFSNDSTVPEIARAVTLCERQVWKILGRVPVDVRQQSLF